MALPRLYFHPGRVGSHLCLDHVRGRGGREKPAPER